MELNYFTKRLSIAGRWLATTLFCLSAIAFVWQGSFFSNIAAMAETNVNLIASVGDRAQDKASEDAGRTKGFVRDTADKVERTARKNAEKVDNADEGGFFGRRAKKDAARIEKRAEEDAARTQKAIDKTKNAFRKAVDND
jgi:ElaB/YqjD/DUF883 family membrane-anchored ribosome-binding protein